ncbi:MAG: ABC transporter, substrate-binding protein (cluster 5, nickel/peptides/opines), partial [uncultured Truepera sp.]
GRRTYRIPLRDPLPGRAPVIRERVCADPLRQQHLQTGVHRAL